MSQLADVYVELALFGINLAQTPSALRSWWESERAHRSGYELSQDQIDRLVEACRERIALLAENDAEKPEQPKPRAKAPRRRQLI